MAKKLTYQDPISLENEEISSDTVTYLIKTDKNKYAIKTNSKEDFKKLTAEPTTRAKEYWPINNNVLRQLLNQNEPPKEIFSLVEDETYELTSGSLNEKQVKELLKMDPNPAKALPFKKQEPTNNWVQQVARASQPVAQSNRRLNTEQPYISPAMRSLAQLMHQERITRRNVQNKFASVLRSLAIDHLEHSRSLVARSFRAEFIHTQLTSANYVNTARSAYNTFLTMQERQGAWGTYIEATALADLFGIRLVVSDYSYSALRGSTVLYDPTTIATPLVMHLDCNNYTHWSYRSSVPTLGNGDCLYNSIAQFAFSVATNLCPRPQPSLSATRQNLWHANLDESAKQVASQQKELLKQFAPVKMPTEEDLIQEQMRISTYSPQVQKQIQDDFCLALKLAREEGKPVYRQMSYADKARSSVLGIGEEPEDENCYEYSNN